MPLPQSDSKHAYAILSPNDLDIAATHGLRLEIKRAFQLDVARRTSNQHIELARLRHPVFLGDAVERHRIAVKRETDNFRLSRRQLDPAKTFQLLDGAVHARVSVMHVELNYLRAGTRSVIAQLEAYFYRLAGRYLARRNLQIAVIELRVGKTMAKGKKRLYLVLVEISVANKNPFRVIDL